MLSKKAATKITASWRQRNRKNTDVCGNLLTQQGTLIFCAFISIFVFNFFYIFIHYYLWIFCKHLYCDESNCCFCFFLFVLRKKMWWHEEKSAFRSNVDLRIVDANDVKAWAKKCDTHKHTWYTMALKKNEETIDMSIRPSNWIVCSSLLENQHVLMSIGAAIVCHKIENNCWMFKMLLPTVRIHCRTQTIWNMERFLMKPDNNFFGNFNFPKIFVVIYSNRQETFQYTHTESYPGLMALLFELLSMHWNIFQQLIEQSTFPLRQKCVSKVFMRWWCASVSVEL